MSKEYCWECEESYSKDEIFDIPIFNKGHTVKWCLKCAMKQLEWTDYRLVPEFKGYKKFKIKSVEDDGKEWQNILSEIVLSYESQFEKLGEIDYMWGELYQLATDVQYGEYIEDNLNEKENKE